MNMEPDKSSGRVKNQSSVCEAKTEQLLYAKRVCRFNAEFTTFPDMHDKFLEVLYLGL